MLRRNAVEVGLQVDPHSGIRVFLDEQRRRRVPAEDRQKAGLHLLLHNPLMNWRRAFVKPLTPGRHFKAVR